MTMTVVLVAAVAALVVVLGAVAALLAWLDRPTMGRCRLACARCDREVDSVRAQLGVHGGRGVCEDCFERAMQP